MLIYSQNIAKIEQSLRECTPVILFPKAVPQTFHDELVVDERDFGCLGEELPLLLKLSFPDGVAVEELQGQIELFVMNVELGSQSTEHLVSPPLVPTKVLQTQRTALYLFRINLPKVVTGEPCGGSQTCKFQLVLGAKRASSDITSRSFQNEMLAAIATGQPPAIERALIGYTRLVQCSLPVVSPFHVRLVPSELRGCVDLRIKSHLDATLLSNPTINGNASLCDGPFFPYALRRGDTGSFTFRTATLSSPICDVSIESNFSSLQYLLSAPQESCAADELRLMEHLDVALEQVQPQESEIYAIRCVIFNKSSSQSRTLQVQLHPFVTSTGLVALLPLQSEFPAAELVAGTGTTFRLHYLALLPSVIRTEQVRDIVSVVIKPSNRRYFVPNKVP